MYTVFTLSIQTLQLFIVLVLKFEQVQYLLPDVVFKNCSMSGNQCRSDETPHSVASHLGLHGLLMCV